MVDLLNIGRGGLLAYRTALSVTGENIANVDTAGYRRRDVQMSEMTGGYGVEVSGIRRAFDALVADRSRSAIGSFTAAETFLTQVQSLEQGLLPGDGGIPDLLDSFFDALDGLSAAPSDRGLRQVTLNAGSALADGVTSMAVTLDTLAQNVTREAAQTVGQANDLLEGLASLQTRLVVTTDPAARNGLMDQRDRMLADLSGLVELEVTLDERGLAHVRLGSDLAGPEILAFGRAGRLALAEESRLTVFPADPTDPIVQRPAGKGSLAGLAAAQGAVTQSRADLDTWAATMAREMNTLHAQGLTLTGAKGGAVFSLSGWQAEPGPLTRGVSLAKPVVTDGALMPAGPLSLVYSAATALWQAQDSTGTLLAEGAEMLALPGLRIDMAGRPEDGDRITLTRQDDDAAAFRLSLSSVDDIAAAGALRVNPLATNLGNASISARTVSLPATGLPALPDLLSGTAVEFLSPGVVGILPSGTTNATLSVQARNAALEIALPAGATAQTLRLDTSPETTTFTLPIGSSLAQLARDLNSGSLESAQGLRLADLGLMAEASDITGVAGLTLSARSGSALPAATLTSDMGTHTGVIVADAAPPAALSVFTRDGRQLSGPALSAAEASRLLTPANGFFPEASYQTAFLNAASGFGSLIQSRAVATGDYSVQLGLTDGLSTWSGTTSPAADPGAHISFDAAGQTRDVTLPTGASAAWQASELAQAFPLTARAETRVALELPASGTLSFRLTGSALKPIAIEANLSAGGDAALAAAINARSGETGITAERAPDGGRLVLVHASGADITLSAVSHSADATVNLTRLSADGTALATTQLGATTGQDSARIRGTLALSGALPFSLSENGLQHSAVPDPFTNGLITLSRRDAGATLLLTPTDPVPGDVALRQITLTGADGRSHTASADPALGTGADLAQALLNDLRRTAPQSQISGAALTALPPNGTQMRVALGAEVFGLRMVDGAPQVTGPNAARLTASFDADNRLQISTNGGDLNGAALVLPADAGEAARFGMGLTSAPITAVIGQPFDAGNLPASFTVTLGGVAYSVAVSAGAVVLPPAFPGTGWINTAYGRVEIHFDARAGDFAIPAQAGAADAGFDTLGLEGTVTQGTLALTSTDNRALALASTPANDGTTLRLAGLPPEDLLVVLSGTGALRLSGDITTTDPASLAASARELRVLDAETGQIGLFDALSGAFLASRTLDSSGSAQFGTLQTTLSAGYRTGDIFALAPNTSGMGDARTAEALANLRLRDSVSGEGGYATRFAEIQARAGAQTRAALDRTATARTERDSAERAESALGAVDLDAEAANLMEQQQAYQANAQVMTVARQLFETLLQSL